MSHASPQSVVERYLREVLGGAGPANAEELIASETLRQRVAAFRAAFPDLSVRTQLLIGDRPFVAVHLTGRGTHRGIFQGIPPTGRSWAASCSALYRIENGRVVDFWENWDLLGILEQLGGIKRAGTASA
jgi:predicted ester cyclase